MNADSPTVLTPEDEAIFQKIAETVVKRGMTVPAILFLETMKPLNFIGAQMLVFFGPFLESLFQGERFYRITELMEDRNNIEVLLRRIEELEDMKKRDEKNPDNNKNSEKPRKLFHLWRK